jgi:hypothetical protein
MAQEAERSSTLDELAVLVAVIVILGVIDAVVTGKDAVVDRLYQF